MINYYSMNSPQEPPQLHHSVPQHHQSDTASLCERVLLIDLLPLVTGAFTATITALIMHKLSIILI